MPSISWLGTLLHQSFRGVRSANPESRDSGYGPSDHSGMTSLGQSFRGVRSANPESRDSEALFVRQSRMRFNKWIRTDRSIPDSAPQSTRFSTPVSIFSI